jgi:hypothetical protein
MVQDKWHFTLNRLEPLKTQRLQGFFGFFHRIGSRFKVIFPYTYILLFL